MPAFSPILAVKPKLLVLGSMPGIKSLEAQQYYAHPRNVFWPIMAKICQFNAAADYHKRVSELMRRGVCIWDVLYDCERSGSLDSRIQRDSERVNDFEAFFNRYPTIYAVGFNGQAARKIFHRHCRGLYDAFPGITWVDLPSTSPAYAAMTLTEKTRIWTQRLAMQHQ